MYNKQQNSFLTIVNYCLFAKTYCYYFYVNLLLSRLCRPPRDSSLFLFWVPFDIHTLAV